MISSSDERSGLMLALEVRLARSSLVILSGILDTRSRVQTRDASYSHLPARVRLRPEDYGVKLEQHS